MMKNLVFLAQELGSLVFLLTNSKFLMFGGGKLEQLLFLLDHPLNRSLGLTDSYQRVLLFNDFQF